MLNGEDGAAAIAQAWEDLFESFASDLCVENPSCESCREQARRIVRQCRELADRESNARERRLAIVREQARERAIQNMRLRRKPPG